MVQKLTKRAESFLLQWLSLDEQEWVIAKQLFHNKNAYHQFKLAKGNGKFRLISAPHEAVKLVQRRILENVLYSISVHFAAHGFIRGRSIVTGAKVHAGFAKSVYNLDLKDAFPSTVERRVRANLQKPVQFQLKRNFGRTLNDEEREQIFETIIFLVLYQGCIPQGAPTSPAILNICCFKLDQAIMELLLSAEDNGTRFRYSRYADDLSFSCNEQEMDEDLRKELIRLAYNCGWKVNRKKIKYFSKDAGKTPEITGLLLHQDGSLTVRPDKINKYRAIIHQYSQQDDMDEEQKMQVRGIVAYLELVYGGIPNRVLKPYLVLKEKHGFKDKPAIKTHFSTYPG